MDDAPPLRAHLLGCTRIFVGEREILDDAWPRRAPRALFLLLLSTPDHLLPRDRVLDLLWPELTPAAALNAFYKALHALRRVLEPDLRDGRASSYVAVSGATIRLVPAPGLTVDVDAFAACVASAGASARAERRSRLREAIALYGGELLPDEPYADWPVARRDELRRLWETACLDLSEAEIEAGQPRAAIAPLHALLASEPAHEEAHRALMRAFAHAGLRDRALRQYDRCRQALEHELGVEPSAATAALLAGLQAGDAATAPADRRSFAAVPPINNLPAPLTPLVGRERDVTQVQELLWRSDVRLVTLTGASGIGKTRLALAVAAGVVDDFKHGVAFVSLASLSSPITVAGAIARVFGIREEAERALIETVAEALRDRELLLILDNFEHVLAAAPLVADLLAACPTLKALVTSREYLNLRGEHEVEVPPLTVPDRGHLPSLAALPRHESVALFRQAVRAARPDFEVTDANARMVAGICARLHPPRRRVGDGEWGMGNGRDGAPIPRHPFPITLDGLAAKHLLQLEEPDDGPRFAMLETIREYAREQLLSSGEAEAARRAHLTFFLHLAGQAESGLIGPDQAIWNDRLAIEHDNLRAALETALTAGDDADAALRLAGALWRFWWIRGHLSEGRAWLARALDRPGAPTAARAAALNAAAELAESQGDYDQSERHFQAALALCHRLGLHRGAADALSGLGLLAQHRGEYDRAVAHHDQALALYRDHGAARDVAKALTNLAAIAYFRGDAEQAENAWLESLTLLR